MSALSSTRIPVSSLRVISNIPFAIAMLMIAVVIGISSGMPANEVVSVLNEGYGETLGYIAIILIPSFILASAISQANSVTSNGGVATAIAPFAGAAMVCPDTAYAALSPVSGKRKLSMMFGSYAGFKLLVPAGPAIIAAMLGGLTPVLIAWGAVACLFCWIVGLVYARRYEPRNIRSEPEAKGGFSLAVMLPLSTLIVLIALGGVFLWQGISLPSYIDYFFYPAGALFVAAIIALTFVDSAGCSKALESGLRRTAPLLLTIGAASALGHMLVNALAFEQLAQFLVSTGMALPALFLLTAIFKISKGSSMATFAGTGGIVSALLPGLGVSAEAATLAMCAGAFVTIAPNDSLYWLVREDAFGENEGTKATRILAVGAALQGVTAFMVVYVAVSFGML